MDKSSLTIDFFCTFRYQSVTGVDYLTWYVMVKVEKAEQWSLTIGPEHSWWGLRRGELWRYHDLVLLFVHRDFVAYYKQTVLGPLWYIIQPLLSTIVFGRVAQLSTDGLSSFVDTSNTFTANAGIFGKVYFPRMIIPVSKVISAIIGFGIQYLTFLGFLAYFWLRGADVAPNWAVIFTPIYVLLMAGIGLGSGIIISSATTKYRDFQMLISFGVQLLIYATPVIYPASVVAKSPVMRRLLFLNPITAIMGAIRYSYLDKGMFTPWEFLYSIVFTIGLVLIGTAIFNRVEQNFMDTV